MEHRISAHQLDQIYTLLQQRLSPRRVQHTLGAAQTAVRLAQRWGADPTEALVAALLHDIAKEHAHGDLECLIEKNSREITEDDRSHPGVWHAVAAEVIAREELGVTSPEIGLAIRIHPTGDAEMNLLEQIIFLSDYIEPTRVYNGVEELRRLAREDLNAAIDAAILHKTDYITRRGKTLHARSRRALESVHRRIRKKETLGKGE